ncbi:MAG TPA: immunoglobulin domain-containing protein, partial [Opitutus sp.]|nr:immunoglobulin domain-containing protein [Opitutus sp.]
DTETSERHGLYSYNNGVLTTIVDNTATVGTDKLMSISDGVVANDGTVFFQGGGMHATSLYRARNGTIDLFQDGSVGAGAMNPGGMWLHDKYLFFSGNPSAGVTALYRKPIDGTGAATVVFNLSTHPDFKAIDARDIEDLQFANDQVLVRVGAVVKGIQRSALLYGAASNVLGDSTTTPGSSTPQSQSLALGGSATLSTTATGTLQWQRNGSNLAAATSSSLALSNVQPAAAGIYTVNATNGSTVTAQHAIVGLTTASKVIGTGNEVEANIVHPNGNIFDQVLLTGPAEAITADHTQNQITRTSYIDLDGDIVQVEFSGPGTLSLVLDNPTDPAPPANYNQTVNYMKGHAGIVITGATEQTNVSVFSVGKATAVNQALFKDNVTYDGIADISFIAISSSNGKFGGVRTANANYFAAKG